MSKRGERGKPAMILSDKQRRDKEMEKEKRKMRERRDNLYRHHNILNQRGLGYDDFYLYYMEVLDLPDDLHVAMIMLNELYSYSNTLNSEWFVEDLLINGKESDTYRSMLACLERLGNGGEFYWNPQHQMEPSDNLSIALDNLSIGVRAAGGSSLTPVQVGQFIEHHLRKNQETMEFWENLQDNIRFSNNIPRKGFSIHRSFLDYLKEEERRLENGSVALQESSLYTLLLNLEFIDKKPLKRFLALAEEYNVEWAMAAFDWSGGNTPVVREALQRAVDESSWGGETGK